MRPELAKRLVRDYPDYFKGLSRRYYANPLRAWISDFWSKWMHGLGVYEYPCIECGDGWYWLIDKFCWRCKEAGLKIEFQQIKEKFAIIRLYYSPCYDGDEKILEMAEIESECTCENCGATSHDIKPNYDTGWYYTLCRECEKKHIERTL